MQALRIGALEALLHDGDGFLLIRWQSFRELGLKSLLLVQDNQPDMCRCLNGMITVSNHPRLGAREGSLGGHEQAQEAQKATFGSEAKGSGGKHVAVPEGGVRYRRRD
ncbi:hypothetical protein ALQ25_200100 [Pseudomonas coronafaciens pv. atropurpurea]|nr:hypothetical protein ALQ25_200100 [Pseudomonas coronafaciens pv. atropurpurea]